MVVSNVAMHQCINAVVSHLKDCEDHRVDGGEVQQRPAGNMTDSPDTALVFALQHSSLVGRRSFNRRSSLVDPRFLLAYFPFFLDVKSGGQE